jgi:hypothetical protein
VAIEAIAVATYQEISAKTYKPGDDVEAPGVYRVTHDPEHAEGHEVTVVFGKKFPPCNHCGNHPRFKAVKLAQHIGQNEHFKE